MAAAQQTNTRCFVFLAVFVAALVLPAGLVGATPAGFGTFFYSASCPDGWSELPTAKGRLLVSVSDPSIAGVTVNTPLSDQEDRVHSHPYETVASFPSKSVAAIDCCNNQGAAHGNYPVTGLANNATSGYPFIQLLFCKLDADTADPVPFGTIGYFDPDVAGCPTDWTSFEQGAGRILAPAYEEGDTVVSDAPPLNSGQDLTHDHTYLSTFVSDSVEYAGVEGCCNDNPSSAGTVTIAGTTNSSSSNLPYIQLLTCVSGNFTFDSNFPATALVYNVQKCPPGYVIATTVAGRLAVAVPYNGQVGASWGGASLNAQGKSDPTHTHPFNGTVITSPAGVGLASGCCAEGYAGNGAYAYVGVTNAAEIDLPYVLAPLCTKEPSLA